MKTDQTRLDKVRGCLIGGAAGDALGYAVEFNRYNEIVSRYGEKGITRYELNHNGEAEISDDTQMTLFTANGLLINDITTAYLEWLHTQSSSGNMLQNAKCWLSDVPEMYVRRAPGMTCMSALAAISNGKKALNNSKGCGGIMRVAPIALFGMTLEEVAQQACDAARLTHLHPMGYLPAGVFAATIHNVMQIKDETITFEMLENCVNDALDAVEKIDDSDYMNELREKTQLAIELTKEDIADVEAISRLGEGWVGDEAWHIAVYCAFKHIDSFCDAIIAAVNHSGDSDSTGAICGNLMGAIHGYDAIPEHFKQNLELHEVILKMAGQLFDKQSPSVKCGVTPNFITLLRENEVFVFGSNLQGQHMGGAARIAVDKFGAEWGNGVGMQGQCYAIPTMHGGVDVIKPYVDEFIEYVKSHTDKHFLVTRIGCGIAGFRVSEIAPLFADALALSNVSLPKDFIETLK